MDSKASPLSVQNIFKHHLLEAKSKDGTSLGFYSPKYSKREMSKFMTSHYLSMKKVRAQANSFDMTGFYKEQISKALDIAGFSRREEKLLIFDVGCGFGSTTFPLLELFPKSHVIASDLSLPMLVVLKEMLEKTPDKNRADILQLNAEKLDFKKDSFDLIVGAAVLHHLFDPEKSLKACERILKPGGVAIFFEPFEEGNKIMRLIYKAIIQDRRFKWLHPYDQLVFRHFVSRWERMSNPDKSNKFFQKIDDKWMFKKSYFSNVAAKYSFRKCVVFRTDGSDSPYSNLLNSHFGSRTKKLPDWVKNTVRDYADFLSGPVKDELLAEGCVILAKKN